MEAWYIWAIAALLLFIVEMFTSGLAVICLSIGSIGGVIAAAVGWSIEIQLLAFAIISLIAIVAIRPVLVRIFNKGSQSVPTNAEALKGRRGVVCKRIDANGGRVEIDGVDWKAISANAETIECGEQVEIIDRDSIVLIVKKL